jgi:hypothetical protein
VRIIVTCFSVILLGQARSVGGDDNGRDNDGRGAVVGEGADARQAAVGRTSYRGTGQNEGETQDKADCPHWLSPVRAEALCAVSLVTDNQRLFPDVCSKAKNGFVVQENCFVKLGRRNIRDKNSNDFSKVILALGMAVRYTGLAAAMIRAPGATRMPVHLAVSTSFNLSLQTGGARRKR